MWSFCFAIFRRRQNNLEGICSVQCYGLRKRSIIGEPGQIGISKQLSEM